ncbi:DUF1643 domain-containing protein [Asaia siamensis]|uniref:DUF1643 domain-containing protein n=1 Tax=Asaia siamensis TaxID=110479 RepID=A0ABQ1L6X4_9PROT|nr:DUF1643 domain-containing protein [Asaia siamensis]GBR09690.1 hypothetical protein AA0323_2552 [Asaia siamensis NRIC 0323]GGC19405.1 hypothetical protein GCM10007207_00750 [Asaia siamensis]
MDQKTPTHHVGSSKALRLQDDVVSTAVYDGPRDCYRYRLHRIWDERKPSIMWLMMNPSVATEYGDDRTVAKCQRYARSWGYGAMFVGNSFAYRCTDQKRLLDVDDPVGPGNNEALLAMAREADKVILAYGSPTHPTLRKQGSKVALSLHEAGIHLYVMRLSKGGRPEHPLYLPGTLEPTLLEDAFFSMLASD